MKRFAFLKRTEKFAKYLMYQNPKPTQLLFDFDDKMNGATHEYTNSILPILALASMTNDAHMMGFTMADACCAIQREKN